LLKSYPAQVPAPVALFEGFQIKNQKSKIKNGVAVYLKIPQVTYAAKPQCGC
jgi:hypothetical protein